MPIIRRPGQADGCQVVAKVGGQDAAEVLSAMVRLVTRRCAGGRGLVAVWERPEPSEAVDG